MSRLIDTDALYNKLEAIRIEEYKKVGRKTNKSCCTLSTALYEISMMPTIEERKTGTFIGTKYDGYADGKPVFYEWKCSECGCVFEDEEPTYNFCPNCGSFNGGGSDDQTD